MISIPWSDHHEKDQADQPAQTRSFNDFKRNKIDLMKKHSNLF